MKNLENNLLIALVNKERCEKELKNQAYIPFLDLAITFKVPFETGNTDSLASVRISNVMLEENNIPLIELYKLGLESTVTNFPFIIETLNDKIVNLFKEEMPEISEEEIKNMVGNANEDIYCVTNQTGMYGANFILYKEKLKEFADNMSMDKIIIIPSSKHELLLLKYGNKLSVNQVRQMVKEVNSTQVSEEDFLSDNIYMYDAVTNEVSIL